MVRALGIAITLATARLIVCGSANAQAIDTNAYSIDVTRGPVIGPGRAIGIGGAYTSLVNGVDGALWNAAAFAARDRNSATFARVDGTISYGRVFAQDFDNAGARAQSYPSFNIGLAGLALQFGAFGIGDLVEYDAYTIGPGSGSQVNVQLVQNHAGLGAMFLDGQLVLGAGYRLLVMALQPASGGIAASPYTTYVGHSAEFGVAYRPVALPIRLGAAVRSEADATHAPVPAVNGLQRVGCDAGGAGPSCLVIPDRVVAPWEIDFGFALQLGPRPFNVRFEDPHSDDAALRREEHADQSRGAVSLPVESPPAAPQGYVPPPPEAPLPLDPRARAAAIRERYRVARWRARQAARMTRRERYARRSRWYFLLSIDLHIVAPVDAGQGLDAFLLQTQHSAGRGWTLGPRVGIESELIPNFMKVRAGTYLEPSRYSDVSPRWHGTFGIDVRLFSTNFWGITEPLSFQISGVIDGADRYVNGGVSVGVWE